MQYDPTRPAPILEAHCRRIVAYLRAVGGTATRSSIGRECRVPAGTLATRFMRARLASYGVEQAKVRIDGRRRVIFTHRRASRAC